MWFSTLKLCAVSAIPNWEVPHVGFRLIQETVQHLLDVSEGVLSQIVGLPGLPATAALQLVHLFICNPLLRRRQPCQKGKGSQETQQITLQKTTRFYDLCCGVHAVPTVAAALQGLRLQVVTPGLLHQSVIWCGSCQRTTVRKLKYNWAATMDVHRQCNLFRLNT